MFSRNIRTAYGHVPSIFYSLRASPRRRRPTVILTRTTPASSPTITSAASPDRVEYEWIEGVEDLEEYCPGGYHPMLIGNVLHNRYEIIDKLGYGGYSTTWLARDRYLQGYVAVKVGISDASLHQRNESRILQRLSHPCIPKILDHFDVTGPNGTHPCYTMAVAQGNLDDALRKPMFPVEVGRVLAVKLASAVAYIHSQGYVHGDLHIRNMLLQTPPELDQLSVEQFREKFHEPIQVPITRTDGQPLTPHVPPCAALRLDMTKAARKFTVDDAQEFGLADFGEAFSPAEEPRLNRDNHTLLPGQPPETFFEPDAHLSPASDIWTMATAIWEILGMKFPFSQHVPPNELLAEHIDVLGYDSFPDDWKAIWERPEVHGECQLPRRPKRPAGDIWPPLDQAWENFNQTFRRKRETTGVFGEEESRAILEMIRGMLLYRPQDRLTADEVLQSEWMVKWALPQAG